MEKAHEAYKQFTADEKLSEAYEAREKYLKDKHAQIEYARDEGREEGRAEVREEERLKNETKNLENAWIMFQEGVSSDLIFRICGITTDQLKSSATEL